MKLKALQNNKVSKVWVCGIFTSTASTIEILLQLRVDVLNTFACVI